MQSRYLIYFLISIIHSYGLFAQSSKIDSVKNELLLIENLRLKAKVDDLARVDSINQANIIEQIEALRSTTSGYPVVPFEEDTIFYIYNKLGTLTPSERADVIQRRVFTLSERDSFNPDSVLSLKSGNEYHIVYGGEILITITKADAIWNNENQEQLVLNYKNIIASKVESFRSSHSIKNILIETGLLILVVFVLWFLIRKINQLFFKLYEKIIGQKGKLFKGIKIKDSEFLDPEKQTDLIIIIAKTLRVAVIILFFYLALPIIFSIFPQTEAYADLLFGYVTTPLTTAIMSFIEYIPNIFTILVIYLLTNYTVKFLKFIANEVAEEKLVFSGFYADWAFSTYNIVKTFLYLFMFVLIFPYLPGSDSPIFQGVSVFLGLLISLGSSSAISNLVAGIVITYMRPFKVGDRIKLGEQVGDVLERNLLVTRIKTIHEEEISIPNAQILSGSTLNYSSMPSYVLHTSIAISYNAPWRKVHELLINAANKTTDILKDPAPFVLQQNLDDFYVNYQVNAYSDNPPRMHLIYSELLSNIQDSFNEAGIEILSPHYETQRDDPPQKKS